MLSTRWKVMTSARRGAIGLVAALACTAGGVYALVACGTGIPLQPCTLPAPGPYAYALGPQLARFDHLSARPPTTTRHLDSDSDSDSASDSDADSESDAYSASDCVGIGAESTGGSKDRGD